VTLWAFGNRNTIWFDQIAFDSYLNLDLKQEKLNILDRMDPEYLLLWYHKSKTRDFSEIPALNNLLYLELNLSNIENFGFIGKFPSLKRLELHYCTKLLNDKGISKISNTLEHLHINQSKKFILSDELFNLKNIRVLCLNSCGNIESLDFLKHFPKLIDFRFVNTNVLNGDLTPIIEHPTIRSVGFLNKRHYNISENRMEVMINEKGKNDYKETIYNGSFSTFKYLD
jgi:hypothetical protein